MGEYKATNSMMKRARKVATCSFCKIQNDIFQVTLYIQNISTVLWKQTLYQLSSG